LAPRVSLVTNVGAASAASETPLVIKSSVLDGDVLYVRVGRVGDGLAQAIRAACSKPETTNKLKGVAIDLRYAAGDDYAAAAAVTDLFVKKEQPLLNWGNGVVRSKAKTDVIGFPAAVLVNRQTAGAAEALAAAMRETGAGLILGSHTAGQAMVAQEFPLKNGDRLRIATAPIQLGDGSAISEKGLKPDIDVEVSPEEEWAYYADAFKTTDKTNLQANAAGLTNGTGNGTNRAARRPRFNEAELVRERREGISEADVAAFRGREPDQPTVQDPALARALDLLRGLALVRQPRS
jgi:C-terminal processing protease CtpA/Prc